ncbi:MAG: endolytic transglycosylase MltG [Lachnospiraceae bacterium]|nr:endolytic transglycosylase MltG [Lachnospiraceae bacterium]
MSGRNVTVSLAGSIVRIGILAAVVIFVIRLSTVAYDFGYRVFTEEPVSNPPGLDISVAITDDMSTMDIGKMLEKQGLIQDAKLFYIQEKVSEYKDQIKPGTYTLSTSMTAEEMMAVLASADEESTAEEDYGGNSESMKDATEEGGASESMTEEAYTEGMSEETSEEQ